MASSRWDRVRQERRKRGKCPYSDPQVVELMPGELWVYPRGEVSELDYEDAYLVPAVKLREMVQELGELRGPGGAKSPERPPIPRPETYEEQVEYERLLQTGGLRPGWLDAFRGGRG